MKNANSTNFFGGLVSRNGNEAVSCAPQEEWSSTHYKNYQATMGKTKTYTDALNCYDTPKMLILVFIEFRENQEW